MSTFIRDYEHPVIIPSGVSPNRALLCAVEEGIHYRDTPVSLKHAQNVTPTNETECSYILIEKKEQPVILVQPLQESGGCVTDTLGNFLIGITGRRRFSLHPTRGRGRFPIIQRTTQGEFFFQRVIFVSSL